MKPKGTILTPLVCLPQGTLRSHISWVTEPWTTAGSVSSRWDKKKKQKAKTKQQQQQNHYDAPLFAHGHNMLSSPSLSAQTRMPVYYVCFPFLTTALGELFCWRTSPAPCLSGALRAPLNFHVFPARGCAFQTLSTRPNKRLIISGDGKEERSPW